jgi:hypothetical protein
MLACIFGRWTHAGKSLTPNLAATFRDLVRKIDKCGARVGVFWTAAKSTHNIESAHERGALTVLSR